MKYCLKVRVMGDILQVKFTLGELCFLSVTNSVLTLIVKKILYS